MMVSKFLAVTIWLPEVSSQFRRARIYISGHASIVAFRYIPYIADYLVRQQHKKQRTYLFPTTLPRVSSCSINAAAARERADES